MNCIGALNHDNPFKRLWDYTCKEKKNQTTNEIRKGKQHDYLHKKGQQGKDSDEDVTRHWHVSLMIC